MATQDAAGTPSHREGMAHPCRSTTGRAQPQTTSRLLATPLARISTKFLTEARAGGREAKRPPTTFFSRSSTSHVRAREELPHRPWLASTSTLVNTTPRSQELFTGTTQLVAIRDAPSRPRLLLQQLHSSFTKAGAPQLPGAYLLTSLETCSSASSGSSLAVPFSSWNSSAGPPVEQLAQSRCKQQHGK